MDGLSLANMPSVLSLQTGRVAKLGPGKVRSAFVKQTVQGPVLAHALGLGDDQQADHNVHGGADMAIYCYPSEHYPQWASDVPRHAAILLPGAFGENITTVGLNEKTIAIGDVFAVGAAEMQVTQPRQPCFKLALRFDDSSLGKIMMKTGRTGWYMRVLKEGEVKAGDAIQLIRSPNRDWTIERFNRFILGQPLTDQESEELINLEGLPENIRSNIAAGG